MSRILCLAAVLAAGAGCSSKDEAKPNPDMKVPDITPGRGSNKADDPGAPAAPGRGPALPRG